MGFFMRCSIRHNQSGVRMFLWILLVCLAFSPDGVFAGPVSQSASGKSKASKGSFEDCYLSFADGLKPFDREILVLGSGAFGLSFAQAVSANFKSIIGQELGANPDSFLGPAYLGDLILSLEKESRNARLGLALGRGQSLSSFKKQNPYINAEGLNTVKSLKNYLQYREGFEFINTLYDIIYEERDPKTLLLAGWPGG